MYNKIVFYSISIIFVVLAIINLNISNNSILENVKAFGDSFNWNGQSWDNDEHFYNAIGSDWNPVLYECEVVENSGSLTIGINAGIVIEGTLPSTSVTYPGQFIKCEDGPGNCWNGHEDCVKGRG